MGVCLCVSVNKLTDSSFSSPVITIRYTVMNQDDRGAKEWKLKGERMGDKEEEYKKILQAQDVWRIINREKDPVHLECDSLKTKSTIQIK